MIRKILLFLMFVLASLASPTQAATYWVSPLADGGGSGADSLSNAMTLAEANAAANPGDLIRFRTGVYVASIAPARAGTDSSNAGRIRYQGFPNDPGTVTVAAMSLVAKYYTKVSGVTVSGSASVSSMVSSGVTLEYCDFQSGLSLAAVGYALVQHCNIGSGIEGQRLQITSGSNNWRRGNIIRQNTINVATTARLGTACEYSWQDSMVFNANTITASVYAGVDTHCNTWYDCSNCRVYDNTWTCYGDGSLSAFYGLNIRDNQIGNVWYRNTILQDPSSPRPIKVLFATSGAGRYCRGNTFSDMYVRVQGEIGYQTNASKGDTHKFGTYISGSSMTFTHNDSLTLRHNTFISIGSNVMNGETGHVGLRCVSNIFFSDNGTNCGRQYGLCVGIGFSDSNLVCSTTPADSANAVEMGGCARYPVGPTSALYTTYGLEGHSHWAPPGFSALSSWETVDPRPAVSSLAFSSDLWPDGYVGAYEPPVVPGDDPTVITLGALETYANMHAVSVYLPFTNDNNNDAVARLFITTVATARTDSGVVADTCLRYNAFCASVFWLQPGTEYRICVRVVDPDGLTDSAYTTVRTREFQTAAPTAYVYVDYQNGSDANSGSILDPVKTMARAWEYIQLVDPEDQSYPPGMYLMSGAHYDSLAITSSALGDAYIQITGASDAWIDGSDESLLTPFAWDSITVSTKKVYFKVGIGYSPRLLACDSIPLFRHYSFKALVNDSTPAPAAGFYRSLTGDTLYVQLEDSSNPANHVMHFGKRTHLIDARNAGRIVFDGLHFRYSGNDGVGGLYNSPYMYQGAYWTSSIAHGALQLYNVQDVRVTNCWFYNNGLNGVALDSLSGQQGIRDVTIDNCSFYDSRLYTWGRYTTGTAVSGVIVTPHHHPALCVLGGRGVVVYKNYIRGHFDCIRLSQEYVGKMLDVDIQENRIVYNGEGAIEIDPVDCANLRIVGNVVHQVGDPLDCDMYFGPMYYVRNVVSCPTISTFHIRSSFDTLKTWPTVHVYHNTLTAQAGLAIVSTDGGGKEILRGWDFANNIFATTGQILYTLKWYENPANSFNYNAWVHPVSGTIATLRTSTYLRADSTTIRTRGLEKNGRFPSTIVFADSANGDWRLGNSVSARDKGRRIPGINTGQGQILGSAPDIGYAESAAIAVPNGNRRRSWLSRFLNPFLDKEPF